MKKKDISSSVLNSSAKSTAKRKRRFGTRGGAVKNLFTVQSPKNTNTDDSTTGETEKEPINNKKRSKRLNLKKKN